MGSWQIAQQKTGVTGLYHFKANVQVLDEALADKASVLVPINFDTADMLSIDHAGKKPPRLNSAPPFHAIFGPDLIALARIDRSDADPLLADAEGVTVDHPRPA